MKKVNKTVTFTPETEEQNLLKKAEKELSLRKYDSFSILCKKALEAFLSNSESPFIPNNQLEQTFTQLQLQLTEIKQSLEIADEQKLGNHFERLIQQVEQVDAKNDQKMTQLQEQINELKQMLSTQDNYSQESQLSDWLQQMDRNNTNFQQQLQQLQQQITHLTQTVSSWEARQISTLSQPSESTNAEAEKKEVREPTESSASHTPPSESEELLTHFSPLLDDF